MRCFRFRLYPSKKQVAKLNDCLVLCGELYNRLLCECRAEFKNNKRFLSWVDLNYLIKKIKHEDDRFSVVHSQVLQNVSDRVAKAYANFFRRVKEKKLGGNVKVGFPRFKSGCASITFPQFGFCFKGKKLMVSKLGCVPLAGYRPMYGRVKTMTIKQSCSGKWFASFSVETEVVKVVHASNNACVGVDVGLESFAVLSNGVHVDNPRFLLESQERLIKAQRALSSKQKGSKNNFKSRLRFACLHERVLNQRNDFLHKLSTQLSNEYCLIAVEKLNVQGMVKNRLLARSIMDASWSKFVELLSYKAESAGGQLIQVNPKNTSQECSGCGNLVKKSLSQRAHECNVCGLAVHRDHNAAINILNRATAGQAESNACGNPIRPLNVKAGLMKQELHTMSSLSQRTTGVGNPGL